MWIDVEAHGGPTKVWKDERAVSEQKNREVGWGKYKAQETFTCILISLRLASCLLPSIQAWGVGKHDRQPAGSPAGTVSSARRGSFFLKLQGVLGAALCSKPALPSTSGHSGSQSD